MAGSVRRMKEGYKRRIKELEHENEVLRAPRENLKTQVENQESLAEVLEALSQCHGLRAWVIAISSQDPSLVSLVEEHTGGLRLRYDMNKGRHEVSLCGLQLAGLYQRPNGMVYVRMEHCSSVLDSWLHNKLCQWFGKPSESLWSR